ncbi:MAG: helix-turn-helix transcriptional regulator [Clostridiales bacterium]|nr:helix-turn-helix transcriptional regulator [Clostridiales bacterium]
MDVPAKIDALRKNRGWSVNRLASEAMLTQSTLNSMYARNSPPKIEVLESICAAFGISLAQFFLEDEALIAVNDSERDLLLKFKALSPEKKKALIALLR